MNVATRCPLLAVIVAVGLISSCGSDSDSATAPTTVAPTAMTTASPSSATTTTVVPSTTGVTTTTAVSTRATSGRGDWAGERFDFGTISSARTVGDHVEIRFDREQLYTDDGTLQSGAQFTEEPIVTGNTDAPMVNDSKALRSFVLAHNAEVLRVHLPQPCADGSNDDLPTTWDTLTPADLTKGATRVETPERVDEFNQVSLTFDPTGLVTRVRLGAGC